MTARPKKPCAPMRADEHHPRLRQFLKRCLRCGGYLDRVECLDVVVRLSHWLEEVPPALVGRIRKRLAAGR